MKRAKKLILPILLLALLGIQLIRPDFSNPPVDTSTDFLVAMQPSQEVHELIRTACYDCHSNETRYPWYAQVAPVSWWLVDHVEHGREELNFSVYGTYSPKRKAHKMEECVEYIENGEMPLDSYTWMHGDADLSTDQRQLLMAYFNEIYALEEAAIEE